MLVIIAILKSALILLALNQAHKLYPTLLEYNLVRTRHSSDKNAKSHVIKNEKTYWFPCTKNIINFEDYFST